MNKPRTPQADPPEKGATQSKTSPAADALRLPPMTRKTQAFAMTVFFIFGTLTTAFVLLNPFGLPFLPQLRGISTEGADGPATQAGRSTTTTPTPTLYQCPMHPEVIEAAPGDCPICRMRLSPIAPAPDTGNVADQREILYWYAPMDPSYTSDRPGNSPMGMNLVPRYRDTAGADVISIDPAQVQNIGVVTETVRTGTIERTLRTVGFLDFNADEITWVNTKFAGWIEKVHVNYVGQEVKRGDPLFEIYSPDLVTTQEEYLRALEYKASLELSERHEARRQAESLLQSTRNRLTYWDISERQIERLETARIAERRLTILSPADGIVTEVLDQALEGIFVEAGMNLYQIADLSTVWVHADVYEADLPWVREGQPAEISFRHDPNRILRGQILFLYPELSKETRTLKICVEIPNIDRRLRAGMYADVILHGPQIEQALLIPDSAVLRSGLRDLVFVALGQGHFEPREITLGVVDDDSQVQVLSGLAVGEQVVTQAQFMLDSESRVREAIAKFTMHERTAPLRDGGAESRQ